MNELADLFAHAIHHHACSQHIEGEIMFAIKGDAAFDPFDEALCIAISDFIWQTADAVRQLSPRARQARIRARVAEFMTVYQAKMSDNGYNKNLQGQ